MEVTNQTEQPANVARGVVFPAWLISDLLVYGAQTQLGAKALDTFMKMQPDRPAAPTFGWGHLVTQGRFWFESTPAEVEPVPK